MVDKVTNMRRTHPVGRSALRSPVQAEIGTPDRPWEDVSVRDDVTRQFNLRLPERLYLMLRFLSQNSGYSMQELCMEPLTKTIEAQTEDMLKALERRAKMAAADVEAAENAGATTRKGAGKRA